MGTGLMPKCSYGRLSTLICLRLCTLLAFALQLQAGGAVTVAHAEEVAEQLYPGRYVAVCKPMPIFGCVCDTDLAGQPPAFPRLAKEFNVDNSVIRDAEYLRMIEWSRLTCNVVTQSRSLR